MLLRSILMRSLRCRWVRLKWTRICFRFKECTCKYTLNKYGQPPSAWLVRSHSKATHIHTLKYECTRQFVNLNRINCTHLNWIVKCAHQPASIAHAPHWLLSTGWRCDWVTFSPCLCVCVCRSPRTNCTAGPVYRAYLLRAITHECTDNIQMSCCVFCVFCCGCCWTWRSLKRSTRQTNCIVCVLLIITRAASDQSISASALNCSRPSSLAARWSWTQPNPCLHYRLIPIGVFETYEINRAPILDHHSLH